MINVNKLLMSVVLVAMVVVKAEDTTKTEVAEQNSEIVAKSNKLTTDLVSQEDIDMIKDYAYRGFEQTKKVFTQYPMYIPAVFFWGRASMAAKIAHIDSTPKELLKKLRRTKSRNMYGAGGLILGHLYCNRDEKAVAINPVASKPSIFSNNIEA